MMKIIIVLLLSIRVAYLSEVNLTNHSSKGFVFNGTQYDPKKYPYVVTILTTVQKENASYSTISTCTGSLVNKLYVLTAAHCLYENDKTKMEVFLGSKLKKISVKVAEVYVPDDYINDRILFSDIGVIKLEKPFANLKKFIQIGGHPKDFKNFKALECTCIGFGTINNDENFSVLGDSGMMMTTAVTYGQTACRGYDKDLIKFHWKEYLCSEPGQRTMTCPGDSGGPMICNNKLYGVCSFSLNFKKGPIICGGPNVQSVHTFVHFHLKWVNNIIDPGANKKKKNSGHSLKSHQLHTILAISLYSLLLF